MTDHNWRDAIGDYVLGTLPADERAALESHLDACATCRAEVRAFREVAGLLAHAAPNAALPPALRSRVLRDGRGSRRRFPAPAWLAAAAALIVALGAGVYAIRAGTRAQSLAAELAARDSILAALLGPEVHVVSLAGSGREPSARVYWNHRRQVAIVTAFDLPPAPAGRTYQLWAIAKDRAPVSMGTFNTGPDARVTLVLPVGAEVAALGLVDLCGVTQEPTGGSPQPTEQPRLVGAWRHTD